MEASGLIHRSDSNAKKAGTAQQSTVVVVVLVLLGKMALRSESMRTGADVVRPRNVVTRGPFEPGWGTLLFISNDSPIRCTAERSGRDQEQTAAPRPFEAIWPTAAC